MQHLRVETHIEAPVEEVWKYWCDTSNWPDFMPRGTFSDVTGPIDEVGTTYVGGMKLMGHEMKGTYEIVEVEPHRLIHEHTDWGPMDNYFRFEPDGDATNFIAESDFEIPGKVPGVFKDMVSKGWVERNWRNSMADLTPGLVSGEARSPLDASAGPLRYAPPLRGTLEDEMSELNEVKIRDFAPADRVGALDVLGASFAGYPPSQMMFGDGAGGVQRLRRTNELLFRPDSKVRAIIAERDAVIVGVLTYADSPDCNAMGARQMLTFVRAVGPRILTVMRTFNKVEKVHPKAPHRHLPSVGVRPDAQGHGVGHRLMAEYARRCDEDGIEGYLETISYRDPDRTSSRSLYERHGFVLADEVPMADDWSMITMRRTPVSQAP